MSTRTSNTSPVLSHSIFYAFSLHLGRVYRPDRRGDAPIEKIRNHSSQALPPL
jgi:hypothetical protein